MNKVLTFVSMAVLFSAAGSVLAAPYTGSMTGVVSGSSAGTTTGSSTFADLTGDILNMTSSTTTVITVGFPGTSTLTLDIFIDFGTNTGTTEVTSCVIVDGNDACAFLPLNTPTSFVSVVGNSSAFTTKALVESEVTAIDSWTGAVNAVVPPVAAPTPVPTMSAYGLGITIVGLFASALGRLRTSAKRR